MGRGEASRASSDALMVDPVRPCGPIGSGSDQHPGVCRADGRLWVGARASGGPLFRPGSGRRTSSAEHGAFARAVHSQNIEQTGHSEQSVYLATFAARDRERAVLGLEPPERVT
jgi:hypothetical protein